MSDQPSHPPGHLLTAVAKLPPVAGVTYRGLPDGAPVPTAPLVTTTVTPTSRDPRVASEGRSLRRLLAVAVRSGRDLGGLSARPQEREVVLLPGTTLVPVGRFTEHRTGVVVVVVEEVLADGAEQPAVGTLPGTREELVRHVAAAVREAWGHEDLPEQTVGKFAGAVS